MGLPRYRTTQNPNSQAGNSYQRLGDDWSLELTMIRLDEISIDCSIAAGFEAQMQFGTPAGYGDPLPIKVGLTTWDRLSQKSQGEIDRVRFRNAVAGSVAQINVEVWGA
jgi:hypothetical protein